MVQARNIRQLIMALLLVPFARIYACNECPAPSLIPVEPEVAKIKEQVCGNIQNEELKQLRDENRHLKSQQIAATMQFRLPPPPPRTNMGHQQPAQRLGAQEIKLQHFLNEKASVNYLMTPVLPSGFTDRTKFDQLRQLFTGQTMPSILDYDLKISDGEAFEQRIQHYSSAEILTILKIAKEGILAALIKNYPVTGVDADTAQANQEFLSAKQNEIQAELRELATLGQTISAEEMAEATKRLGDPVHRNEWINFGKSAGAKQIGAMWKIAKTRLNRNEHITQNELLAQSQGRTEEKSAKIPTGAAPLSLPVPLADLEAGIKASLERRTKAPRAPSPQSWWQTPAEQLDNGATPSLAVPIALPTRDIELIRSYSLNKFSTINQGLRGERKLTAQDHEYIQQLNRGLEKLPQHQGVTFRGGKLRPHELTQFTRVGQTVTIPQYWSTSQSLKEAKKFVKRGAHLFVIQSKEGREISDYSYRPHEREVLFRPASQFLVKAVRGNTIYLEEQTSTAATVLPSSTTGESGPTIVYSAPPLPPIADLSKLSLLSQAQKRSLHILSSEYMANRLLSSQLAQLAQATQEKLNETILLPMDVLEGSRYCTPTQLEELAALRKSLEQQMVGQSQTGMSSQLREFVLSPEANPVLSKAQNIICLLAVETLFRRDPSAAQIQKYAKVKNSSLGTMLLHALKQDPIILESLPLNTRLGGSETLQDILRLYVNQKNIQQRQIPFYRAIEKAYTQILNTAVPRDNAPVVPYNIASWQNGTYRAQYQTLLARIEQHKMSELIGNLSSAGTTQLARDQKAGLQKLANKMGTTLGQSTASEFIEKLVTSPWILSPDIAHLLFDRAHLMVALKAGSTKDFMIPFKDQKRSMREVLTATIDALSTQISESNGIMAEQMFTRLHLLNSYLDEMAPRP